MNKAPTVSEASNKLLAAFPDAVQADLQPHLSHETLPQGTICFIAGDVVGRVYFPASGLISLLVAAGGDDLVEGGVIGNEGAAGLHSAVWSHPSFTRAIVRVPGTFWSVPAGLLRETVQRSEEAKALLAGYTETLWAEAQQLAACNAIHAASQRLARWLLQAADRSRSNELPLTHELLAQMIGLRRTSVTQLALELQYRGIIRYTRANIVISDRAMLEAAACRCYQLIRQLYLKQSENVASRQNRA